MHKIGGTHVQFMNNYYAKFKIFRDENYFSNILHKPDTFLAFYREKILSSRPKNEKKIMKCVQNMMCTSSMCELSFAKFEYKRMKTVGVTDYTYQTPLLISWKKCLS